MVTKIKKASLYFLIVIMIIVIILLSGILFIQHQEKKRTFIELNKIQNNNTTLIFYKDDCKDCQKIFIDVYLQKISGQPIILVNMNNQANRKYINQYSFDSVPTIVKGSQKYSGSNINTINKIIRSD